jgi:hypothetical protein
MVITHVWSSPKWLQQYQYKAWRKFNLMLKMLLVISFGVKKVKKKSTKLRGINKRLSLNSTFLNLGCISSLK